MAKNSQAGRAGSWAVGFEEEEEDGGMEGRCEERKSVVSSASAAVVAVAVSCSVVAVVAAAKTAAFLLAAAMALVSAAGSEASGAAQGLQLTVAMGVGSVVEVWMMRVKPLGPSSERSCCGEERRSWEGGIREGCLAWLWAKVVLMRW